MGAAHPPVAFVGRGIDRGDRRHPAERRIAAQKHLIEDLLDASRIQAGKLRLTLQPTDIVAVVRAAIEAIQPTAVAKGVEFHVELGANAGTVLADAR
jgi:signal transduction histidine kinase